MQCVAVPRLSIYLERLATPRLGVYVNGVKKPPGEATILSDGDEICFGVTVPKNELRYVFFAVGEGVMLV